MTSRVLLIGLDGATMNMIKAGVSSGKLPTFKRLMERGAWGELKSSIPPLSPPAWSSIFTGVNPGKHGIYNFVKHRKDSKALTPISSRDLRLEPVWKILSRRGKRCIMMNMPFAYPLEPVNGVLIAGLGAPSRDSDFTFPKQWRELILRMFPDYDVDFNEDLILQEGFTKHLSKIDRVSNANIQLYKYLLQSEQWDFFAAVFRTLDVVQHYTREKEVLLQYYQLFDEVLKHTLESVRDAWIIVCSDHGFRDVHTDVYVNNWLETLGLLKVRRHLLARAGLTAERFQLILASLGFRHLIWSLKRGPLLHKLLRVVPSEKLGFYASVDWEKTKAYYLGNAGGMILLNKEIVKTEERNDVVQRVVREAGDLTDPKTGRRVVAKAYLKHEAYKGEIDDAPDVTLVESEGYRLVGGYTRGGSIFKEIRERTGDHDMNGVLFAFGPDIRAKVMLDGASVCDITPTILYLMGLEVPEYVDGLPLRVVQSIPH